MKKTIRFIKNCLMFVSFLWFYSFFYWIFFGVCKSCGSFYAPQHANQVIFFYDFWPMYLLIIVFSLALMAAQDSKGMRNENKK